MAKDLPYFKFYTSEWTDGDITLEPLNLQGLFINVCAFYWSKEGEVTTDLLQKRFKSSVKLLRNLYEKNFLKCADEKVTISFLDEQLKDREAMIERNRVNGASGGRKRKPKRNPDVTHSEPTGFILANPNETQTEPKPNQYRGEERREEYIHLYDEVCGIFNRRYISDPQQVPAGLVNWFVEIEYQCKELLKCWDVTAAIKQVKAYKKHCLDTNRKRISTNHKVAETLRQVDWVGMTTVEMTTDRGDPYSDARYNLSLWTKEAWEDRYKDNLKTDENFRKAFGYEELSSSGPMGGDLKSRKSA